MLQKFTAQLVEKKDIDKDVVYLRFKLIEGAPLMFQAGQYVLLHVPKSDGTVAFKHFSMVNTPQVQDQIELIAKIIPGGVASTYFLQLSEGDTLTAQGPAGLFFLKESTRDKIFLATGTGIAPVMSMLTSNMKHETGNVSLFWGLRSLKNVYFFKELKQLVKDYPNFRFYICLSQEKDLSQIPEEDKKYFLKGRVNAGFESIIQNSEFRIQNFDYYLCGNRDTVESLKNYLLEKAIPKEQIYLEKF